MKPCRLISSLCVATGLALSSIGPLSAQAPHTHQHSFGDAQQWARVFDDPERDAWQKPHEVIQALALKPDSVVADLGAGTGYFSMRLAHTTPKGKVYAVDLEPAMVKHLAERAEKAGLKNVVAVQAKPGSASLPGRADLVLLVDVYHHIDDRERYFRDLQKSLTPGGQVAIIDFRMDSPVGPPRSARIEEKQVRAEMQRAGYALAREHPFLPNQYFLVFQPR
jgi:predicted methyltransferase